MAFVLTHQVFYPLADTYRGPAALFELQFTFPVSDSLLNNTVVASLFSLDVLDIIKDNYLSYEIWRDARVGGADGHLIRVWTAGEAEENSGTVGPFFVNPAQMFSPRVAISIPALLVIAVLIGTALLLGYILWQVKVNDWGVPEVTRFLAKLFLPIAAVGAGAFLISNALRGRS
jgi:hypothetical protein